jgi:hypothetical protein
MTLRLDPCVWDGWVVRGWGREYVLVRKKFILIQTRFFLTVSFTHSQQGVQFQLGFVTR